MQIQDLSYLPNSDKVTFPLNGNDLSFTASIEIFSLENLYIVKPGSFKYQGKSLVSNEIVWGDTEQVEGKCSLTYKNEDRGGTFDISASLDRPIRGIKLRLEGLPCGTLINCFDDNRPVDKIGMLLRYPEGWRTLTSPYLVFLLESGNYLYIRCLDTTVREKRFFIKKEDKGMRIDIVQDEDGTTISSSFHCPKIEWGITSNLPDIYEKQSEIVQKTYDLKPFGDPRITPSWLKDISLVVTLHMEAFTGHIFHTYEQALEDIKKLVEWLPGNRILVYLPGWEGRYYYKYGNYCPDDRLGGPEKLKELVDSLHDLGCKVMGMYGINMANKNIPAIKEIVEETEFVSVSGARYHCGSVDWEGAHHYDFGELVQLNVGAPKWSDLLFKQIKEASHTYGFDGAFLDIAACFTNDARYPIYEGVLAFSDRLRTIKKDFLVSGEGYYDGLSRAMPLFQSGHTNGKMNYHDRPSEALFSKFSREFAHLSLGDVSRGSSGVHEQGTNDDQMTPLRKGIIPTLCLVENTISEAPEKVQAIVSQANEYAKRYLDEKAR